MKIRDASEDDVAGILAVLTANRADTSLFQQSERQVRRTLSDFVVAVDKADAIQGCAAIHWHSKDNAEILAVAVVPSAQGTGVGRALMKECVERATKSLRGPAACLWLATVKHGYFARYGFEPMSRFSLPALVLATKFFLVFEQSVGRWLPALFGRHTFMRWAPSSAALDRS